MTRLRLALASYVVVLFATDIAFSVRLGSPAGARIHTPVNGLVYPRLITIEGDAWSRQGIDRVDVVATHPGGAATTVEATRLSIRYRGAPISPLAAWSARLDLPVDGDWTIGTRARLSDGRSIEAEARLARVSAGAPGRAFVPFGRQHLIAIAVVAAVCLGVALRFRVARSPTEVAAVGAAIAAVLWANEYTYHWYWFTIGAFTITNNFMLHMCGLAIVLIPFLFTLEPGRGRQYLFEIIYFWGLGGAVQALLAPDIGQHGFPELKAFAFFISHGLICAAAVYMIAAKKMSLTFGSLVRALVATNVATLLVYLVNLAVAAVPPYEVGNYFMIGYPPPTGSVIDVFSDLFGPSPRYIVGLEAMALLVFLLIYLPFPVGRALRRSRRLRGGGAGPFSEPHPPAGRP